MRCISRSTPPSAPSGGLSVRPWEEPGQAPELIDQLEELIAQYEGVSDVVTVTASAGEDGAISPSGETQYYYESDAAYTITPNEGYVISDVLVDGQSVGAVSSYTFSKLTTGHTIRA